MITLAGTRHLRVCPRDKCNDETIVHRLLPFISIDASRVTNARPDKKKRKSTESAELTSEFHVNVKAALIAPSDLGSVKTL